MPARTSELSRHATRCTAALALAASVALLGACSGRAEGTGDGDPARVAPASTFLYVVADLQPAGDQGAAAQAIAAKLLRTSDPAKQVEEAIGEEIVAQEGSAGVLSGIPEAGDAPAPTETELGSQAFKRYVEPWLGRRAAVAVTGFGRDGELESVAILATTDAAKAREALERLAGATTPQPLPRSYRGVDYRLSASDTQAVGVVGDYVVKGGEPAFRAAVDASQGSGLSATTEYAGAAGAAAGKLAFGYLNLQAAMSAAPATGPMGALRTLARASAAAPAAGPITFALTAQVDALALDIVQPRDPRSAFGVTRPSRVIPTLPGDTWLTEGIAQLGRSLMLARTQAATAAERAELAMLGEEVRSATGLDLERDIAPTVGDVAVFLRGSTSRTLSGGAVLETPNPAAALRLLRRAAPAVESRGRAQGLQASPVTIAGARGFRVISRVRAYGRTSSAFPGAINAVVRGRRMVIAYGDATTRAALTPRTRLNDSLAYRGARASLGGAAPDVFVSFAPIAQLLRAEAPTDHEAQELSASLAALSTLATTNATTDTTQSTHVVLAVR